MTPGKQEHDIPGSKERTDKVQTVECFKAQRVLARRHSVDHQAWLEEEKWPHQDRKGDSGPGHRLPARSGELSIGEEKQQQRQDDKADELQAL